MYVYICIMYCLMYPVIKHSRFDLIFFSVEFISIEPVDVKSFQTCFFQFYRVKLTKDATSMTTVELLSSLCFSCAYCIRLLTEPLDAILLVNRVPHFASKYRKLSRKKNSQAHIFLYDVRFYRSFFSKLIVSGLPV